MIVKANATSIQINKTLPIPIPIIPIILMMIPA